MYTSIMVPLDGSELAECVLPHVEGFITECRVKSIVLVRVVEPAPTKFDDTASISATSRELLVESIRRIEEKRRSAALDYLNGVGRRLEHDGLKLTAEVLVGGVAESLADYTEKTGIDLIIIATHGRSGISRWVRGSIADRVLRFSPVPVLMVRANGRMRQHML
jgi:nucleotide-binding universal stress UspA family protein